MRTRVLASIFVFIGLFSIQASASIFQLAHDFETRGIEFRGGYFKQEDGSVISGGLFWAPEMDFIKVGKMGLFMGGRVGAWILKDRGDTPAFAPSAQVLPRLQLPFYDLSFTAILGGGYGFVLDRPFVEIGAMISKTFTKLPLSIRGIGIHYELISANIDTDHFGLSLLWRW